METLKTENSNLCLMLYSLREGFYFNYKQKKIAVNA